MIIVNFASVRIITDNVEGLVDFYENVLGVAAKRPSPVFAEFILPTCTLAIGHTQTTALFGMDTTLGSQSSSSHTGVPYSRCRYRVYSFETSC